MASEGDRNRELYFNRLQVALEEELRAIVLARTATEADLARRRAQARLAALNRDGGEALTALALG